MTPQTLSDASLDGSEEAADAALDAVDDGDDGVADSDDGGCSSPSALCGGVCTDLTSNVLNCGGCGKKCSDFAKYATCSASTCSCPASTVCGGECKDTQRDAINCGMCGKKCLKDEQCSSGTPSIVTFLACWAHQSSVGW